MAEVLGGAEIPRETRATCDDCAMVGGDPVAFDARLKCCTYEPRLPNFTIGALLGAGDALARFPGAGVLGLPGAPVPGDAFGRDPARRCSFLDDAIGCTIWAHREAMCAAYHCKYEHGARGSTFWGWMQLFLRAVEDALARWCAERLAGTPLGRDYFLAAAALVDGLSWAEVAAIGGLEVAVLAQTLREAHARLVAPPRPARVAAGVRSVVREAGGRVRLVTYRVTDPVDVPREVLAAVDALGDGVSLAEASAALGLDEENILRLLDLEVLVPAQSLRTRRT